MAVIDIQAPLPQTTDLATFCDHAAEALERLAENDGVGVLTVDGQPRGVVLSPAEYDRMADWIEQAGITEGIRRGLADVAAGRVIPAEQAMIDIAVKLGLDLDTVLGRT